MDKSTPLAGTLVEALLNAAEKKAFGFCFLDRKEQETKQDYSVVWERAVRTASGLAQSGLKKGERIALILPTSPGFMDAFFGCQILGAIPVPLYPPVRLGRLEEYIQKTAKMLTQIEAKAIVVDNRTRKLLGRVVAETDHVMQVLSVEKLVGTLPQEITHSSTPDDVAFIQFSSGTTQHPKPIALTHRQVISNVDAIIHTFPQGHEGSHAGVCWLPLYHDMGLIGCVFTAVLLGAPLVLIPPEVFLLRPATWLRAISRYRANVSPAPNFAYGLCVDKIKDEQMEGVDLSSWRLALNGAEPVAASTLRAFQERFAKWGLHPEALTPVYGLAEASLAVTFSDPTKPFTTRFFSRSGLREGKAILLDEQAENDDAMELATVGKALLGFQVEIRNAEGHPLEEGDVGAVWIKGPSIMKGYLSEQKEPIVDGWLDTGDKGFLLEGELYLTGRAKDIIVLRGRNHSPFDIENACNQLPGVRTGCCVAVGQVTSDGEALLVFVEVKAHKKDLAEACFKAIKAHTGLEVTEVVLLEPGTIPRTSSGKLRRGETLKRWEGQTLLPPEKMSRWRIVGALVQSWMGYRKTKS